MFSFMSASVYKKKRQNREKSGEVERKKDVMLFSVRPCLPFGHKLC